MLESFKVLRAFAFGLFWEITWKMKTPKTRKESSTLETQPKGRDLLAELNTALKEIKRQNSEKLKWANELKIANKELVYQTSEKADRTSELVLANEELVYRQSEKSKREDELAIANKELAYQTSEKADRDSELIIVKQTMMGQKVEIENLNYRNELPGLFNRKYFLDALKKYV